MKKAKTKLNGRARFLLVLLALITYMAYTVYEYGLEQGLSVTALTWAFFVFATPVADAGFLIAFPIRLITGFRMLYTQLFVWGFGVLLVAAYVLYSPEAFDSTALLQLFYTIITTPWPLWLILILSAIGTYVSILFDDDLVDIATAKHKKSKLRAGRRKLYLTIFIFTATFALYAWLLYATNTSIGIFAF